MLHDGQTKHARLAAKGTVDSNCQKTPPGRASAMHTQCQQDSAAAGTVQLHPDSPTAAQSQQDGTAAVLLLTRSTAAVGPCPDSAARSQQQIRPGCSAAAKAAASTTTGVVNTCGAIDAVSAKPQHVKHANTKESGPRSAVQQFTAALVYSLLGCFTCEPEPVLFEDDSSEEDVARSSMSFATNQKLLEFISANHQLEYDRLRKRIAHARANSLSKYQPS